MKKSDLKVNDIVLTRDGRQYMIHEFDGKLYMIGEEFNPISDYGEDLDMDNHDTFPSLRGLDIVEVRRPDRPSELINRWWHKASVIWQRDGVDIEFTEKTPVHTPKKVENALRTISEYCEKMEENECKNCVLYDEYDYGSCQLQGKYDAPSTWNIRPKIILYDEGF